MSTAVQAKPHDAHYSVRVAVDDERRLLKRYAKSPEPALEEELVERFMPLARSLAARYRGRVERSEDLMQVASLALVKALRGFDPERGRRFAAYAAPTILGELRRHFRDHTWRLHVPRGLQERSLAVERASAALADELGATPDTEQVADRVGLSEEQVRDVREARESQRAVSLDMPVHRGERESVPTVETIGGEEPGYDEVDSQLAVENCANLEKREEAVIRLRFEEDLNQYEIGERLGYSQMQVSRVLRRGLAKLLEAIEGDERPAGRRIFEDRRRDPRFPNGRSRRRGRAPGHRAAEA